MGTNSLQVDRLRAFTNLNAQELAARLALVRAAQHAGIRNVQVSDAILLIPHSV